MRSNQLIALGATILAGVLWIFLVQNWIFLNLFAGLLLGTNMNLATYLQAGSSPSFSMLFFSCVTAVLIWVFLSLSGQPRNSEEVRRKQPQWWLAFWILVALGWAYQLFFTVFIWQMQGNTPPGVSGISYFPVPPIGWLLLLIFVIFDVMLVFWLPTVLASPRSYRFVVPGAVKLLGGR